MGKERLYLITLEIDPMDIDGEYNPLPSHLTLVSRFWSSQRPEQIEMLLDPIFQDSGTLGLKFESAAVIGPKHTSVHLVEASPELVSLHTKLVNKLESTEPTFANPQFILGGWKPHVSKREGSEFSKDTVLLCTKGYLIEVTRSDKGDTRLIRNYFTLKQRKQP